MPKLLQMYLTFLKIGCVSFGGGYAMLPLIENEIITVHKWLTESEFFDVLAISQITPGPIAINSATFIGLKYLGYIGAFVATCGMVTMPFIFISIVNRFMEKYKKSKILESVLYYIRPVTVALILSAFWSTFQKSIVDARTIIIFTISFVLLYTKKLHPIAVIFLFGFIGIVSEFI